MIESETGTPSGEFCLHASSIIVEGRGLVFMGHSTCGKSTIVRLLSRDFKVISDDKVKLIKINNVWWMMNGDSHNKFADQKGIHVGTGKYPVLSFIRIFPSGVNEIWPIGDLYLCKYIMDAVFEVDRQRHNGDIETRKKWFYLAVDLSREFPGWTFCFKKDFSIVELIKGKFYN